MKKIIILSLINYLALSCSSDNKLIESYKFQALSQSKYRGLIFTAHKNYESSILYWYDFKTGNVHELTRGQSGDPKLFLVGNKIYFFNRQTTQSNYFTIDTKNDFFVSEELPLQIGNGDPHSVLLLDDKNLLLSCPTTHSLSLLNLEHNHIRELYSIQDFTPGNLIKVNSDKKIYIYTLSRGTDPSFKIDNSQKLYKLVLNNKISIEEELTEVFKSNSTFSDTLLHNKKKKDSFFSLSFGYKEMNENRSSFDEIEIKKTNSVTLRQLDELVSYSQYSDYGPIIAGLNNSFYASVKNHESSQFEIIKITYSKPLRLQHEIIHTFSNEHTYPPLLIYDKSNKCLFIGEGSPKENGQLHIHCDNKKPSSHSIQLHPYQGILVPQ